MVFSDGSGCSLRPVPGKTGAPRSHTPFRWHGFDWPKLSAVSAVTPHPRVGLRWVQGTLRSAERIVFLRPWLRRIPGVIFLFGDGLNPHRSKKTRAALRTIARGR